MLGKIARNEMDLYTAAFSSRFTAYLDAISSSLILDFLLLFWALERASRGPWLAARLQPRPLTLHVAVRG